jgi:hypothetical protein
MSEVRKLDQTATMNQHDRVSVNVSDDVSKSGSKHWQKVLKSSRRSCICLTGCRQSDGMSASVGIQFGSIAGFPFQI